MSILLLTGFITGLGIVGFAAKDSIDMIMTVVMFNFVSHNEIIIGFFGQ